MKELNVLSPFNGISCGRVALERADIKVNRYVSYEIDDAANEVSKFNYPNDEYNGDVFEADFTQYKGFDLLIGGSPCLTGDCLVMTKRGLIQLQDIEVGDLVIGHDKQYHKVINTFDNGLKQTYKLTGVLFDELYATGNHKFYVRKKEKKKIKDKNNKQYNVRTFSEPIWKDLESLYNLYSNSKDWSYYLGYSINQNSIIPKWDGIDVYVNQFDCVERICNLDMGDSDLWYIVGRWLGDGWLRKRKGNFRAKYSGVVICCSLEEKEELASKIPSYLHYTLTKDKSIYKFVFNNVELAMFLSQFGEHAYGKFIPGFVYDLPTNLLEQLIKGYIDSDGHIGKDTCSMNTVSRELAYGMSNCIMKVYKTAVSINKLKIRKNPHYIEGRLIKERQQYQLLFKIQPKHKISFYENGYIWFPLKEICIDKMRHVYDIEVEHSHSFQANNCIVHNCTYWSIAKAGDNRETTCEGFGFELFMQYVRALRESGCKWFIYENNASISPEIQKEISKQLGIQPIKIDSADFSAQIRKRLYWTNIPVELNYMPSTKVFADIEYKHDYRVVDFSKYKDTMRVNEEGNCWKWDTSGKGYYSQQSRARSKDIKMNTVPASGGDKNNIYLGNYTYRKLHPIEAERLQTLPDNYTSCIKSNVKRIGLCGNGWTVDVIAYILSYLKKNIV